MFSFRCFFALSASSSSALASSSSEEESSSDSDGAAAPITLKFVPKSKRATVSLYESQEAEEKKKSEEVRSGEEEARSVATTKRCRCHGRMVSFRLSLIPIPLTEGKDEEEEEGRDQG